MPRGIGFAETGRTFYAVRSTGPCVVSLVDAIPTPLVADNRVYGAEPRFAAVFASAAAMLDIFGRDAALSAFLATPKALARNV
jgi:hypothetical protein